MGKAVVYLGASSPVHKTHTALIRALLDEGHDHVFIFILCWSPDRFGATAAAGTAQLAKWLLGFPAADRARVTLDMVKGEADGAKKMRAVLGPEAAPQVEVCFSQKYSGQTERINQNWLPLYTKEFPGATARFLTDEIDPGAAAFGTSKFVDCLAAFREAKGSANAIAALDEWCPEQETPKGWAAYVKGLLHGANDDPFYTPAELEARQVGFFADSSVRQALDGAWRTTKIPGGAAQYFADPKNFGTFWHKMAIDADAALFKRYCLRQQGTIVPSALEMMPPVPPVPVSVDGASAGAGAGAGAGGKPYTVLAAAAMHTTAERLVASDPARFSYYVSKWRKFPDGTDNITLGGFDPVDKVSGSDVLFLASFDTNDTTLSQLHALTWLCESAFVHSLTVLLAFLPTGTMERYLQPGRIPAGNTLAKLLSALPATGGKRTRIMIYDVHAPPTQYFFGNTCAASLHTACPLAIAKINAMDESERIDCVAFPDDGACKRFAKFFQKHLKGVEIVTCNKVRTDAGGRIVTVTDGSPAGKHVMIMDDLIQTGGTLYESAVALQKAGAKSVSGFVVHAVFPGNGFKRFLKGGDRAVFERFWLSSSNPAVCQQIPSGDVFEVLDLAPRIVHDLEGEPSGRSAWS